MNEVVRDLREMLDAKRAAANSEAELAETKSVPNRSAADQFSSSATRSMHFGSSGSREKQPIELTGALMPQ